MATISVCSSNVRWHSMSETSERGVKACSSRELGMEEQASTQRCHSPKLQHHIVCIRTYVRTYKRKYVRIYIYTYVLTFVGTYVCMYVPKEKLFITMLNYTCTEWVMCGSSDSQQLYVTSRTVDKGTPTLGPSSVKRLTSGVHCQRYNSQLFYNNHMIRI